MSREVLKSQKASYVFDGVSEEHRLDNHRQSWLDNRVTVSREDETRLSLTRSGAPVGRLNQK